MNIEEYKLALKRLALLKLNKYISYDLINIILDELLNVPLIPCIYSGLDITSYNGTLYILCDKNLYNLTCYYDIDNNYYDNNTQVFKLEERKYKNFHNNSTMEGGRLITYNNKLYIIAGLVGEDCIEGKSFIYNNNNFKEIYVGNKCISYNIINNNLYICTENYDTISFMDYRYKSGVKRTNHMITEITKDEEICGPVYENDFQRINKNKWSDKKDKIDILPNYHLTNLGFLCNDRLYPGKLFKLNNNNYILYYNNICKLLINEKGEIKFDKIITSILKNKKRYCTIVHNNLLYVIGGMCYDIYDDDMFDVIMNSKERFNHIKFKVLSEVDIFDGDKWIKGKPLNTPRVEAKVIVYHGKILVIGGYNYEYWKEHFDDYIDENNKYINSKDNVTEYNKKNNTRMLQFKSIYNDEFQSEILEELVNEIIDFNFNVNINTSEYLDV